MIYGYDTPISIPYGSIKSAHAYTSDAGIEDFNSLWFN